MALLFRARRAGLLPASTLASLLVAAAVAAALARDVARGVPATSARVLAPALVAAAVPLLLVAWARLRVLEISDDRSGGLRVVTDSGFGRRELRLAADDLVGTRERARGGGSRLAAKVRGRAFPLVLDLEGAEIPDRAALDAALRVEPEPSLVTWLVRLGATRERGRP